MKKVNIHKTAIFMNLAFFSSLLVACGTGREQTIENTRVTAIASETESGEPIASRISQCVACHTHSGNSTSPMFPKIAGQQESYLNAQMTAFRKHLRADKDAKDYMWGMARSLTDQDIVDISRFFATRPIPVGIHGNEALTAIGREIFKSGIPAKNLIACQTCHGVEARGLGSFPGLAGQHAFYIKRQLSYFASGERSEDPTMGPIAKVMSPAEISAVAEYLQSL